MKLAKRIFSFLSIALFPFLIILSSIRLALTPLFINLEYRLPGFPVDTYGFSTSERLKWAQFSIDYLLGKIPHNDFSSQILSNGTPLFNARELSHMLDVRNLTDLVLSIWLRLSIFFLIILILAILFQSFPQLINALKTGGKLTILLIVTILLGVGLNFNLLFTKFHQLFFESDTWLFYLSDNLIRIFPMRFWRDLFIFIGICAVVFSFIPQLILPRKTTFD